MTDTPQAVSVAVINFIKHTPFFFNNENGDQKSPLEGFSQVKQFLPKEATLYPHQAPCPHTP